MKTTRYFEFTRNRPDRKANRACWIDQAIKFPQAQQVQSDGRLRRWAWIGHERKWLRVILLEDVLVDLDASGNLVALTIEHARYRARLPDVHFEESVAGS